MAAPPNT